MIDTIFQLLREYKLIGLIGEGKRSYWTSGIYDPKYQVVMPEAVPHEPPSAEISCPYTR